MNLLGFCGRRARRRGRAVGWHGRVAVGDGRRRPRPRPSGSAARRLGRASASVVGVRSSAGQPAVGGGLGRIGSSPSIVSRRSGRSELQGSRKPARRVGLRHASCALQVGRCRGSRACPHPGGGGWVWWSPLEVPAVIAGGTAGAAVAGRGSRVDRAAPRLTAASAPSAGCGGGPDRAVAARIGRDGPGIRSTARRERRRPAVDGDRAARATRSAGRSTTCGSRSPIAATSAAPTACRRRSSGRTSRSCRATEVLTLRGDRAAGPGVRRARRREAPASPAASRSSGATCRVLIAMLAAIRRPDGDAARPDPHDERLRAAAAGRAARGGRAAAGHGQPRLARRRDVPRDERRRLPGGQGPRRDRGGRGGRARRRSRSTWSSGAGSTRRASCRWPAGPASEGLILRFIEYMDVGHTNGWRMDDVVAGGRARRARSTRRCRSRPSRRATAARSRPLALPRRHRRGRASSRR